LDIKSCKFCKRTFRGFSALCPSCVEQLDNKYLMVRNYLDRNSMSNISRVAEETEVDEKSLLYLIRDGRIAIKGEGSAISCLKCGMPITSGKYCDKCKTDLVKNLEATKSAMEHSAAPAPAKPKDINDGRGRMHMLKED
jgi:uncharacterized protein